MRVLTQLLQYSLIVLAAFILVGCDKQASSSAESAKKTDASKVESPLVKQLTAQKHGQNYRINGQGFLAARDIVEVVSEVPGIIARKSEQLYPGGRINKNDIIFEIQQNTFKAEKDQATAALKSAKTSRQKAQLDLNRQKSLKRKNLVSQELIDQAAVALASAQAQEEQAAASLTLAEERFEDTLVRAPFDAVVLEESISLGSYAAPGQKVATIYNLDQLEVNVGLERLVAQDIIHALNQESESTPKNANPISIQVNGQTKLRGRVKSLVPAIEAKARTVNFIVSIDMQASKGSGTSERIKPPKFASQQMLGEYVDVSFPATSPKPLYFAPEEVIRKEQYIFGISKQSKLYKIPIEIKQRKKGQVLFSVSKTNNDNTRNNSIPFSNTTALLATRLAEEAEGLKVAIQQATK